MCRVKDEKVSYILSEYKILNKRNMKRDMATYLGIFIGDDLKNMVLKEPHSGTSMSLMMLLRTKVSENKQFCGILQSIATPTLKLDQHILLLLIKPRRRLRSKMAMYG